MEVLLKIITFLVLIIWAVLGFVFWIPMLTRTIGAFTSLIFYYNLTNKNPRHLRSIVEDAIRFYPKGFNIILSIMKSPNNHNVKGEESGSMKFEFTWEVILKILGDLRIIREVITTAFFWGTFFLIF